MSYDSEVLADSPLVYLKLDETVGALTAVDLGSLATAWTYGAGAVLGSAPIVTGGTSAITNDPSFTAEAASLDESATPVAVPVGISIEIFTDLGASDQLAAMCYLVNAATGQLALTVSDAALAAAGRYLGFLAENGATVIQGTADNPIVGAGSHQLAVTADLASETVTLYVDGAPAAAPFAGGGVMDFITNLSVGGASGSLLPTIDVVMEALSIYPTALSGARIAAHYAAGALAPELLRARGATAVVVTPTITGSAAAHGSTLVRVGAGSHQSIDTAQRTVGGLVLTMTPPAVVAGAPTVPKYWAKCTSSTTAIEGPAHIHTIPDPDPIWDPYTSGWSTLPPPPTSIPWFARWSVQDLPDPSHYDAGFYWLGDPSSSDGTSSIQSGARQWRPDGSTPHAPSWFSHYPFKPSVTAVNHYLQGGGIVNHPKGVNFNSHFIEHMWMNWSASVSQPYTWVMAGMITSHPSSSYIHAVLDGGVNPGTRGIHLSASDCNTARSISETVSRNALWVTESQALICTQDFGKVLRARTPVKVAPCMFVGIFNGTSSYVGIYRPGSKVLQKGAVDNHGSHFMVMGRQHGTLSQGRAGHLLMFEIRFWQKALTTTELDGQYKQLSSTYQFDRYRSR